MPVKNPCSYCGCSLQTGTKIVLTSIASLVLSLVILGFGVIVATKNMRNSDPENLEKKYDLELVVVLVVASVGLLFAIFQLITNIVLLVGANQRHYGKCRFWFIVYMIFLVLFVLLSLVEIVLGGVVGDFAIAAGSIFEFLIGFAIEGYMLWVVHAFMEEIKEGGPVPTAVFVNGPGFPPQTYIYTSLADGQGNLPPSYAQTQEGYVTVPLNKPQGPGFPSAPAYPPPSGFYSKMDAEKGRDY